MKFGQVDNPQDINFAIPPDKKEQKDLLSKTRGGDLEIKVGCAKWNKADLKGFYPKGVKDELGYYASQFNCIELNATFYKRYWEKQYTAWREGVPDGFLYFPKFNQSITHFSRLKDVDEKVSEFVENVSFLKEKLGMPFLQMHNNFGPKDFDRVRTFVDNWKYDIPLAMEFRHTDWYNDPNVSEQLYDLLESNKITNVLVDTAGRRDLMHMRLTTPTAFVRWVGANHESDYARLDEWVKRVADWKKQGLNKLYFFVHQNIEKESPLLSAYFIKKLNKKLGTDLHVPKTLNDPPED
jgi:uncharacterized protein YecE (DUF72 family)